jgi:hypothetical protein
MNHDHPQHLIEIKIDQQVFKLEPREYTPRELLKLAGDDPAETTLVEKRGHEPIKHLDLDKPVCIEDGEHFVVYHNAPVPVS